MSTFHAVTKEKAEIIKNGLERFAGVKILVLGDIMVDRYVFGNVERISPEAPVPILHFQSEEIRLGGAANVALNLRAMGLNVSVCSRIGDDLDGKFLSSVLAQNNISTDLLQVQNDYQTITKTRVVAGQQQLLRVDRESTSDLPLELQTLLAENISKLKFDAVIFSDYGKGFINENSLRVFNQIFLDNKTFTVLDPKKKNFDIYGDIDTMTPNHHEAADDIGLDFNTDENIKAHAETILKKHRLKHLLITRGAKGMALISKDESGKVLEPEFIPTYAKSVFDVCGAGDTVIAAFTAGKAAGLSFVDAAILANVAAGIVVSKFGTATASKEEILEVL